MSNPTRFDELVTRNRFRRVRDVAFAAFLLIATALAAGSISTANEVEVAMTLTPAAST